MTGGSGNAPAFLLPTVLVRGHAMIVLKFGGTSVGTVDKVRDAASIIERQPTPRAAIVSAASGITNMLLEAAALAANDDPDGAAGVVRAIVGKHLSIVEGIESAPEQFGALAGLDQLHAALED